MSTKLLVDFGPDQFKAVKKMAKEQGLTQSAVVRFGVALYQIAMREREQGNALGVVQGERVVKEIAGMWGM